MVKLLVESGADVFTVGRDQRTPYMIALAAGQVSVVKYLRDVEEKAPGEKPLRPQRKYCKAFHMSDLRKYPKWSDNQIDRNEKNNGDAGAAFPDDDVVFLHQDFKVTRSAWHNEDVNFDTVDPGWEEFCVNSLKFKVPDDLDLLVPTNSILDPKA
jgi:ankyrin repeat protein